MDEEMLKCVYLPISSFLYDVRDEGGYWEGRDE